MGQPVPFICPIDGCRFHSQISHADPFQVKYHLKHGHGYGELQETAIQMGFIRDETERRNPDWLTERLAQYAIKAAKSYLQPSKPQVLGKAEKFNCPNPECSTELVHFTGLTYCCNGCKNDYVIVRIEK